MDKTKITTLGWVGLIAAPVGWTISRLIHNVTGELPLVPLVLLIFVVILAGMMFTGARAVHAWITDRRYDRYLGPLRVARILAFAKAAEFFGAAVVGAYVGLAVLAIDHVGSPMGRDALLRAGLLIGAAAVATVAAVVLERACLVPPIDEDNDLDS